MTSLLEQWNGEGIIPDIKQEQEAQKKFKKWQVDMYASNTTLSNIPKRRMETELQNIRQIIYKKYGNKLNKSKRTINKMGILSRLSSDSQRTETGRRVLLPSFSEGEEKKTNIVEKNIPSVIGKDITLSSNTMNIIGKKNKIPYKQQHLKISDGQKCLERERQKYQRRK